MSRTSDLYRLQSIDKDLADKRTRLEEIERILADSSELTRATSDLEKAEARLNIVRSDHSKADHLLESQRAKLKNNEKLLYGGSVTNPKELEDLQKEAVSLRKHLETLEDRLLEVMIDLEGCEKAFATCEDTVQSIKNAMAQQHQALINEKKDLLDSADRLSDDRSGMAARILPDDLDLYSRLQEKFGNRVIARLEDQSCGACGLQLARSDLQEARNSNTISRCPQCGRILFAAG